MAGSAVARAAFVALFALSFCLAGAAASVGRHVFLDRDTIPRGWSLSGHAAATAPVQFIVALKQRNLQLMESLFWAISTPGSRIYRQFMTADAILDIVAPPVADHDAVVAWLIGGTNGAATVNSSRDAIDVETTVSVAESLFACRFYNMVHDATGKRIVRVFGQASMPKSIAQYVSFIEGISTFPIYRYSAKIGRAHNKKGAPNARPGVVPQTCTNLYQIPDLKQDQYKESSQGAIEFEGECFNPADLAAFSTLVNVPVTPLTADHIIGPNQPSRPQLEASLDVEFIATINNAATSWFWLESGNGWLYQFVSHFFSTKDVPSVISISYGWSESDQCQINPQECQSLGVDSKGYVERVNTEFQKIGARGVSIMVSSGDSGAHGRTDPTCTSPVLKPDYPGCSPYITSVGATQVDNPKTSLTNPPPICSNHGYDCVSDGTEVAVSFSHASFTSGGGFSLYAQMPDYQTKAVNDYLNSGVALPPSTMFNRSNRAYPDVAAVGSDVLIYQSTIYDVGGTSCSAPAFAAIVALLNHYSLQKSGKVLGFLNPFLYQMYADDKSTFHDITVGDNKCTEAGCRSTCQGYLCAAGWDPVTGLGTPNTKNMIDYVQKHLS